MVVQIGKHGFEKKNKFNFTIALRSMIKIESKKCSIASYIILKNAKVEKNNGKFGLKEVVTFLIFLVKKVYVILKHPNLY